MANFFSGVCIKPEACFLRSENKSLVLNARWNQHVFLVKNEVFFLFFFFRGGGGFKGDLQCLKQSCWFLGFISDSIINFLCVLRGLLILFIQFFFHSFFLVVLFFFLV